MFCLYVYLCTKCMPGVQEGLKRESDPLNLKWKLEI